MAVQSYVCLLFVFPVDYGDWFDYVLEMEEIIKKGEYNIHLVYYEDLKEVRGSSRVHYSRPDIDMCISKGDIVVVVSMDVKQQVCYFHFYGFV